MTAILLAAGAAVVWGMSDYCGGRGSRRAEALAVGVGAHLLSLPVLALALLVVPGRLLLADLAWGVAAGLASLVAIVLLYQGLSMGAMTVVSPVTAVTAALVPLAVGLLVDGLLPVSTLAGAGAAVVAIALVSVQGPQARAGGRVVALALAAGSLFGAVFILLSRVDPASGLWALVGVRLGALAVGVPWAARLGARPRLPRPAVGWAALAGSLDVVGTALFLVAVTHGHLSLVGVLASLYPASTVLLALGVDRERLAPLQVAGLGFAAAALILITL